MIIIVLGLPGSGKSYFASRLAEKLNATYVSTDELRFKLFPTRTYSASEKLAVYDAMLNMLNNDELAQKAIVFDGTFYKKSIRNKFETEARKRGSHLIYIEVTAQEKSIMGRLQKPRMNSEADVDVYHKLKDEYEPLLQDHLILDSSESHIDTMLQQAIQYIETCQ